MEGQETFDNIFRVLRRELDYFDSTNWSDEEKHQNVEQAFETYNQRVKKCFKKKNNRNLES